MQLIIKERAIGTRAKQAPESHYVTRTVRLHALLGGIINKVERYVEVLKTSNYYGYTPTKAKPPKPAKAT